MGLLKDSAESHNTYPWARLHADTILLALLVFISGVSYLLTGEDRASESPTVITTGGTGVPYLLYFFAVSYIVSGAMLFYALLKNSFQYEIMARIILMAGTGMNVYRQGINLGWTDDSTIRQFIYVLIVILTIVLRISVFSSDRVTVQQKKQQREGEAS